jgi:putative addiction module killer protein
MFEIIKTETFDKWLRRLKDRMAIARINARIRRMSIGNLGDVKLLRDGISEARIDCGPGYRLYFMRQGERVLILLAGGDKSTQDADIIKAISIAKAWRG